MDNKDKVWIDRAEYERLQSLEQQAPYQTVNGQVMPVQNGAPLSEPAYPEMEHITSPAIAVPKTTPRGANLVPVLTAVAAIASFVYTPALTVFLVLGIVSLIMFFRTKNKTKTQTIANTVVLTLGVGMFVVFVAPVLFIIALVVIFQIGCSTGTGSCTSV